MPIEGRGRYFGSRNFIMLAGMLVTLLMGEFITRIGEPLGYQVAFLVATLLAVFAIFFFNRIEDPLAVEKSTDNLTMQSAPLSSTICSAYFLV